MILILNLYNLSPLFIIFRSVFRQNQFDYFIPAHFSHFNFLVLHFLIMRDFSQTHNFHFPNFFFDMNQLEKVNFKCYLKSSFPSMRKFLSLYHYWKFHLLFLLVYHYLLHIYLNFLITSYHLETRIFNEYLENFLQFLSMILYENHLLHTLCNINQDTL